MEQSPAISDKTDGMKQFALAHLAFVHLLDKPSILKPWLRLKVVSLLYSPDALADDPVREQHGHQHSTL